MKNTQKNTKIKIKRNAYTSTTIILTKHHQAVEPLNFLKKVSNFFYRDAFDIRYIGKLDCSQTPKWYHEVHPDRPKE